MKRWSKLRARLYDLIDPALDFQIHCEVYRMKSQRGHADLLRYWIALNGEAIWDYPKQFAKNPDYPHLNDVSDISEIIREYVDTPIGEALEKSFENDRWGLIDILRAADRRLGRRQWEALRARIKNPVARKLLEARGARGNDS